MAEYKYARQISVPVTQPVVSVTAYPNEVQIKVHALDGALHPDQAEELTSLLVTAVNDARALRWGEDGEPEVVDTRS